METQLPIDDNDILAVPADSAVQISCLGSGNRLWLFTNGSEIPVVMSIDQITGVGQFYDSDTDTQVLVIQRLADELVSLYHCVSDYILWGIHSENSSVFIATPNSKCSFSGYLQWRAMCWV